MSENESGVQDSFPATLRVGEAVELADAQFKHHRLVKPLNLLFVGEF